MSSQNPSPKTPPIVGWDINCTRMVTALRARIHVCLRDLAFLFQSAGLDTEVFDRITPAGVLVSFRVHGHRGPLCSVDYNIVDGMVDCQTPGLAVDVNLLEGGGEVLRFLTAMRRHGPQSYSDNLNVVLMHAASALNPSRVYDHITRDFDLLSERPRRAA
jgi:hypothetical protein